MKFTKHKFSELYEIGSGISTTPEQAGHGAPFVSFSTIFNNYFLPDELPDLMDTSVEEQEKYSVKEGDILLTRTSETLDELAMSCVALSDYPQATFSGFAKRLRPLQTDKTYPKFMGFYLRSPYFRKIIDNNAIMTLRASFNEDIFSYINLLLPDYDTQVKVGDFLYKIERLIQINNREIQKMQELLKTIYDYWFIQFDFPDKDGKDYKSSNGKMYWNKQLKRKIPVGWKCEELSKIAEEVSENNIEADAVVSTDKYTPIDCLPKRGISFFESAPIEEAQSSLLRYSYKDILVGAMRVYFHRVCIAPFDGITRTTTFVLRPKKKEYLPFVYQTINRDDAIKYATINSVGTQQPYSVWKGNFENYTFAMPPKELIERYNTIAEPYIEKILCNEKQNERLNFTKELLIPLLMNGQVLIG